MKTWILFAASLVFSISAFADHHQEMSVGTHAGGKGEMKECRKQMMEFCKGKKRGPEMIQCMEENKSKMSAECQQKLDEKKEQMKNHAGPCKADREKLCAGIKPGEGRIRDCMKSKMAELSPECKANIEKMKADHAAE